MRPIGPPKPMTCSILLAICGGRPGPDRAGQSLACRVRPLSPPVRGRRATIADVRRSADEPRSASASATSARRSAGSSSPSRARDVVGVRGNPADPLSRGHICPKGVAIADVYADPDRLRRPVRRVGDGPDARWEEIGWDEAFDLVADNLAAGDQRARRRRARRLPRQPQRPQPRLDDPRHRDVQVLPDEEPLLAPPRSTSSPTSSSRT